MKRLFLLLGCLALSGIAAAAGTSATLPDGWRNRNPEELAVSGIEKGIRIRILKPAKWDGAITRIAAKVPDGAPLVFRGDVSADRAGIAYLSVKLYRDGKEVQRLVSRANTGRECRLEVEFRRGTADRVELLCRMKLTTENIGGEADFRNLEVVPAAETKAALPRFELVPGFEACGIYVNSCAAESDKQFRGKVFFRGGADKEWRPALDLAYLPGEKSARGSLLNLKENTAYRLRLELDDNGKAETVEREFRTRSTQVPVARTVELGPETKLPLVIRDSGAADGYIRYTAKPGFVLDGGDAADDAIRVDGAKFLIFDGLTVRGGRINAVNLDHASHIRLLNCDVFGFGRIGTQRPELDGKFYEKDGRPLNNDAGIRIRGGKDILVERCYIHDPRGTSNSWFYSHPAGPNAIFVGEAEQVALRYNDFIGSDAKRWNDAVEGWGNGSSSGSVCRDAEVTGNYFAFGNDDGMELDGGQGNCRFRYNKTEGTLCGVSTAPCLLGPSYLFGNLFCAPGDVFGFANCGIKNNYSVAGTGRIYFLNNTIVGRWSGISAYGGSAQELAAMKEVFKGFSRNNLIDIAGRPLSAALFRVRGDFDYDLLYSASQSAESPAFWRENFGQELHAIAGKPEFVDAARGNYNLRPGSPGYETGVAVPGVIGGKPSIGAFQPGTAADLPFRPVPFHADAARLDFASDTASGWKTEQVKLTVTDPAFRSEFRIVQNAATRFFRVTPDRGVLEYGKPVTLAVTVDPGQILTARIHSGAFLVRLPDGFSRAVSVRADSTGDRALLARDRAGVVYGEVSPQADGETSLSVEVPEAGDYYLFVRTENPPWAVSGSIDGGEFRDFGLLGASGPGKKWVCLGSHTYTGKANRPVALAAGRHTVKLRQLRQLRYSVSGFALAKGPEAFLLAPRAESRFDAKKPAICLAGDSTVADYEVRQAPMMGWGQQLVKFCRDGVEVRNYAACGRSTVTFRNEERWRRLLDSLKPGDFVLIQFGHNDQKKDHPQQYAAAETDFPANLKRFAAEVREKGAHPVFATPIARRVFGADGTLNRTLAGYPDAVRKAGREAGVPVIDLNAFTAGLYAGAGEAASRRFFTYAAPGEYPGYPAGRKDDSHVNVSGAELIAGEVAAAAKRQRLPLGELFR